MIGSVVVGKKPWNNKYNVGLIIDEIYKGYSSVRTYKVLWTSQKIYDLEETWEYKLYGVTPKQEVSYTWEVSESLECISAEERTLRE